MVEMTSSRIGRWLNERGWSRRRGVWLIVLFLPIWFPFLHALVAFGARRVGDDSDSFRTFAFNHGYVFLYGLPVLVALGIFFFSRMSFGLRFYMALLYALGGTLVGYVSIEIFEHLFMC